MARALPLADGERLLWSSPRGRSVHLRPGNDPRFVVGMFIASFYVLSMVIALGVAVGTGAMGLLCVALVLAWVGWRRLRARPAYFLSTHRLYHRSLLGRLTVYPLEKITRCRRHLRRARTRYGGFEEHPTEAVVLSLGERREARFGPMKDFDGVWDLLQNAVLAKSVDLHALPGLEGEPSPAERREDLFLALRTRKGDDTYGPLFLGPTKLIHFTEPLPRLLEGIFLTVLASPASAEQIEPQLAGLVRHPQAGHSLVVERAGATLSMNGAALLADHDGREDAITLRPDDAARAARFLARVVTSGEIPNPAAPPAAPVTARG